VRSPSLPGAGGPAGDEGPGSSTGERTRERILSAAVTLACHRAPWSLGGLTFAEVARAAGVSERTIYRYFPTQVDLQEAVAGRWPDEVALEEHPVTEAMLPDVTRRLFEAMAARRAATRELPSEPRRKACLGQALRPITEGLDDRSAARMAGLVDALWGQSTYLRLADWGLDDDEAVSAVTWCLELLAAASRRGRPTGPHPGPG